jgi:phosphatidylinositol dimannoside acyltransferase
MLSSNYTYAIIKDSYSNQICFRGVIIKTNKGDWDNIKMNLQTILNSALGVGTSLILGQIIPEKMAYRFVNYVSRRIASNPERIMVKATRANQWVIAGENISTEELDRRTLAVFGSIGCSLFDFYHNLHKPEKIKDLVVFTPRFHKVFQERLDGKHGAIFIATHTSAFDLGGAALALNGLCFQTLSFPNVNDGYAWQNRIRRRLNLEVTPLSMSSLQLARERLQNGGTVLSGLDRPHPGSAYKPRFFGRPAALPVFHVRLGLRNDCPIYVVGTNTQPDGNYVIDCSEPIWMQSDPDPYKEIIKNAEKVLLAGEVFIRNAPEQWAMTYPVWPEVMNAVS